MVLVKCFLTLCSISKHLRRKVVLIRADVARLPFATSSLAAVHAGAAIHCWPQPTTSVSFLDLSKRMYTQICLP
jgi:hypothetical protein